MGQQADQVRDDILRRVISRALLPGDRIDEMELRNRLELSGTPVREALLTLEAVGVVERRPRDGARIASLDLEGMVKMTEVLAELEGAVAYRAARRINRDQADVLEQAVIACKNFADGQRDPGIEYYDLNLKFHTALMAAAGNERLSEELLAVGRRLIGYLSARHSLPMEVASSAHDHRQIFEAVTAAEGQTARDLMIRHVTMNDTIALDVMNTMRTETSSPDRDS